jgi:hypothetical protein
MNEKSELPYEYGFARIGSTMNYLTREFKPLLHAFDMSKLNALGVLVTRQPKGELTIDANSFTKSTQESSSFSTNSKVRAGFPFFKSSIEHHNTQSGAKLDTANGLSLKVRHSLIGYDIVLNDDITPEQLYACATPNFKAAYEKLVTAHNKCTKAEEDDESEVIKNDSINELGEAYYSFQLEFGHGFITKLKLISTASGELHVTYDSHIDQDEKKYGEGASITIGKPRKSVGASNAQDWVKAHGKSESEGSISAQVESIPGISSVADWANAFISQYAGEEISKIGKNPPTSISAPTTDAKAPEIPSLDPPKVTKEDLPTPSIVLDSADKVIDFMRMKEMKANGGNEGGWDTFSKKFKNDADQADPVIINNEVNNNQRDEAEKDVDEEDKIKKEIIDDAKGNHFLSINNELDEETQTDPPQDISLGEYDVLDFEFTNYADYFPGFIPKAIFPTRSGLNIAKINVYLMTRQLIGSYFNYISQLPGSITRGYINPDRAASYENILQQYSDFINSYIKGKEYITDEDFEICTAEFDQMLEANTTFVEIGKPVYDYFNKNYEIFSKAAFGFVLTANCVGHEHDDEEETRVYAERYKSEGGQTKDSTYKNIITKGPISTDTGNVMSPWRWIKVDYQAIVKDSVRFMPIIHGGKKPYVALATYLPKQDNKDSGWAVLGYCDKKEVYAVVDGVPKPRANTTLISVKRLEEKGDAHCERFHLEKEDNGIVAYYDKDSVNESFEEGFKLFKYVKENKERMVIIGYNDDSEKKTNRHNIDTFFIPVDYDMMGEGLVNGIPMWQDFPFELMKASITAGYDKLES